MPLQSLNEGAPVHIPSRPDGARQYELCHANTWAKVRTAASRRHCGRSRSNLSVPKTAVPRGLIESLRRAESGHLLHYAPRYAVRAKCQFAALTRMSVLAKAQPGYRCPELRVRADDPKIISNQNCGIVMRRRGIGELRFRQPPIDLFQRLEAPILRVEPNCGCFDFLANR